MPLWNKAYEDLETVDYIYISNESLIEITDSNAKLVESPLEEGKIYKINNNESVPDMKFGMVFRSVDSVNELEGNISK